MKLFKHPNMKLIITRQQPTLTFTFIWSHLLAVLLLLNTSVAVAESEDETRERLLDIKEQLQLQTDNIKQQKTSIQSMEQKLECTYNLLQSYNLCEEQHEKNSEGYISCMRGAKSENTNCLGNNT